MKTLAAAALLFLSCNCAATRQGYVKIQFVEGKPAKEMVCIFEASNSELQAQCISMRALAEALERDQQKAHEANKWKL